MRDSYYLKLHCVIQLDFMKRFLDSDNATWVSTEHMLTREFLSIRFSIF